MEILLITKDS